jgi:hypothetical protein
LNQQQDRQIAEFNDQHAKEHMKQHKEAKGHFAPHNFTKGEEVRVKLCTTQSKNIPPNTIETYTIKDIHGTQIIAERLNPDKTITNCTRDSSYFKRVNMPTELLNSSTDGAELTIQPTTQLAVADTTHAEGNNPIEAIEERLQLTDPIEETLPSQEIATPLPRVAAPLMTTTTPTAVTTKRKNKKRNEPPRQTPRPIRTKRQPDWLVPLNFKKQKLESSPAKASGNQAGTSGATTARTRRNSGKNGITVSKISLKKARSVILRHQVRRHKLATMEGQ